MAYIKCDGCGEIIEIPAELCPDPETIAITEPYYCDACEPRSGLTRDAADDGDAPDLEDDLHREDFSDEYTKVCVWCLEMNKESSSFCWACEGEI